jgi:hypothetical protein
MKSLKGRELYRHDLNLSHFFFLRTPNISNKRGPFLCNNKKTGEK